MLHGWFDEGVGFPSICTNLLVLDEIRQHSSDIWAIKSIPHLHRRIEHLPSQRKVKSRSQVTIEEMIS